VAELALFELHEIAGPEKRRKIIVADRGEIEEIGAAVARLDLKRSLLVKIVPWEDVQDLPKVDVERLAIVWKVHCHLSGRKP
jgi:hypothetical protein